MISVKYASIIAVAAFVAGSFVASPELRAYAANTIGSADIIDGQVKTSDLGGNAVTSAKIKDGEIKTADIATGAVAAGRIADGAVGTLKIADDSIAAVDIAPDAVGASELVGVSNFLFGSCSTTHSTVVVPNGFAIVICPLTGLVSGDNVIVQKQHANGCFFVINAFAQTNQVQMFMQNLCNTNQAPGSMTFSVIAYKPG
jgi:hypothetical protein